MNTRNIWEIKLADLDDRLEVEEKGVESGTGVKTDS